MTPEEMRVAIAEACGWVWYRVPPFNRERQYRSLFLPAAHEYPDQSPQWTVRADGSERQCNWGYMTREGHVRDYPNDLNAMHEAERVLSVQQQDVYARAVAKLSIGAEFSEDGFIPNGWGYFSVTHATAAQRAEAFCRTLWPERFK